MKSRTVFCLWICDVFINQWAHVVASQSVPGASPVTVPIPAAVSPDTANDGRHDFDFIEGRWKVNNHQLRKTGGDEWNEFELDYEGWTMMGGLANVDRIYGLRGGKYFEGVS